MQPLVALTRIDKVESIHKGYICVANSLDKTILSVGDPNIKVYLRSSGKPFQAVPLVSSGALEKFNISLSELAIMCSSHSGEYYHLEAIRSILQKIGLNEQALQCGAAYPINQNMNHQLIKNDLRPSPLHNCCSGKHTGLLVLCKHYNFPVESYAALDHPVQRLIHETFAELLECDTKDIMLGIDGCGLPSCHITLHQIAWLYSLLAKGSKGKGKYSQCFGLIQKAMTIYPQMLEGYNEFSTELGIHSPGKVIGKVGSEGLYCIAVPEKQFGACIKIADGNERAVYPVVIHLLSALGVFDKSTIKKLEKWAYPPIQNHKGIVTGYTIPIFELNKEESNIHIGDRLPLHGMASPTT